MSSDLSPTAMQTLSAHVTAALREDGTGLGQTSQKRCNSITRCPSRLPNEAGIASTQAALGLKRFTGILNALEVVFQLLPPAATSRMSV